MRWLVHIRFVLARRPWIVWSGVGVVSLLAGLGLQHQVHSARAAEEAWGAGREVLVATRDVAPGTAAAAAGLERRRLPAIALPGAALDHVDGGAVVVRAMAAGAVVVPADIGQGDARFALVEPGQVVVAVPRPDVMAPLAAGDSVEVTAIDRTGTAATVGVTVVSVTETAVLVAAMPGDAAVLALAGTDSAAAVGIVLVNPAGG